MARNTLPDSGAAALVEGFARVVAVDARQAWLEPEPGTSCGGCAAAGACGAKGLGTLASRLESRRFPLAQPLAGPRLAVGERIVVGVSEDALVKGSLTVYALPLLTMFGAGALAQSLAGSDALSLAAMLAGLGLGLAIAQGLARRLSAGGDIAPRYLRRAGAACPAEGIEP